MIDGKPYKTLRHHLATNGLTPDEYRQRYYLKADDPMVAETCSESRRAMAKKIGLGRKPGTKVATAKSKTAMIAKAAKLTAPGNCRASNRSGRAELDEAAPPSVLR